MRRRRRQLLVQRRLDMGDAAAGGVGRKPTDQPSRRRNRQTGSASHEQKAREPEVMGVGDCPIPEAVGFLERQPEAGTNQSRRPARDQCQKGQREKTARLLLGSGVIIRLEFHWGANVIERNHLANGPDRREPGIPSWPFPTRHIMSRPNRGRNRNRLRHALFALRSPILSAPLPRCAQHLEPGSSPSLTTRTFTPRTSGDPRAVSSPIGTGVAF
jgi:hypothetical protein